jgi:hypothetical protein
MGMHRAGRFAPWTLVAGSLVVIVASGCAPSRDAGFEEDPVDEPRATDEAEDDVDHWQSACEQVLAPVDGDRAQLQELEVLEALDVLDETSRVHSALTVPRVTEQVERLDELVILAPLDTGVPADLADGAAEDGRDVDAGVAPPEAFVVPGGALLLADLVDTGQVETADGGVVRFIQEDDRMIVERGDAQVEVVCADLQVQDAVIHVLSGEPYDVADDDALEPDADADREELAPDIDERLDELDDPDGSPSGTTDP